MRVGNMKGSAAAAVLEQPVAELTRQDKDDIRRAQDIISKLRKQRARAELKLYDSWITQAPRCGEECLEPLRVAVRLASCLMRAAKYTSMPMSHTCPTLVLKMVCYACPYQVCCVFGMHIPMCSTCRNHQCVCTMSWCSPTAAHRRLL